MGKADMAVADITHWIGGTRLAGDSPRASDVFNPATGEVSGRVRLGDAAVVVNDAEPDAWVAAIQRLLTDSDERRRLSDRGYATAARYRWEETARQTWGVYRKVCA